ncbi:hypothetical protein GCM10027589_23430 [Actinocorallia lasiicapitis]
MRKIWLAVVLIVVVSGCSGGGDRRGDAVGPAEADREIPASPLGLRTGEVVAWTGTEMVVWGGAGWQGFRAGRPMADGAAYAPGTDVWRPIAAGPLSARKGAVSVWTGGRLLVWGGSDVRGRWLTDGAAYNPEADAWEALPAGPKWPFKYAFGGPVAVWTGSELVVWGGSDPNEWQSRKTSGLAYNPQRRTWRKLPAVQLKGFHRSFAIWDGDRLIVITEPHNERVAYDPAADTWSRLPAFPMSTGRTNDMAWTGSRLFLVGNAKDSRGGQVMFGGTARGPWTSLPDVPQGLVSPLIRAGDMVLSWGGRPKQGGFAFLERENRWVNLPPHAGVPRSGGTRLWTGKQLLVWGGFKECEDTGIADCDVPPLNSGLVLNPSAALAEASQAPGTP